MKALLILLFSPLIALAETADLVISAGGDVNFSSNEALPQTFGISKWGRKISFAEQSQGLRHLLKGSHVNFCNIETVISDRMDLPPAEKLFKFQAHPRAVEALIAAGFNLFSVANNHTYDYGHEGMKETLYHMSRLSQRANIAFSGLGKNEAEALTPQVLNVQGYRIGFLAFSNAPATYFPGQQKTGVLGYGSNHHLKKSLKKLREMNLDLRIVSIHTGKERQVELEKNQRDRFHWILKEGNVDVIFAHHPHVTRPVEYVDGRVIFYSLGNYMMIGAADLTKFGPAADYGLFAKLYFKENARRKLELRAVQAVPLKAMNWIPKQMGKDQARERVQILNNLGFQELQNQYMHFDIQEPSGTGLWLRREK